MEDKSEEKGKLSAREIEQEAIGIVRTERDTWEDAEVFVTEKIAFCMRPLIRQLRKNYWGIFDNEYDPLTGRKKIWIPMTETMTEAVVKSIDFDTKDINFRATNENGYDQTEIIRAVIRGRLIDEHIGEDFNMLERDVAIDGTAVWKTWEEKGKAVKRKVDLLNVYIDPNAECIQDAYRFTERVLLTEQQVQSMKGWMNTDVEPHEGLHPTDPYMNSYSKNTSKYVDCWDMYGKIPEYLITGNKADDEEIDGHIIVSGLEAGTPAVHLIERNMLKDSNGNVLKPYEECWFTRIAGRWYGKGIPEKLLMLQLYLNIIVNIRINRSYVSQLGLWKIKKGAGITPQMVSRLGANGAITVRSMDDIEQLTMQEASQASYTDEQNIQSWGERLTNAFEVVTGEQMPSSTPATNAVIQNNNAKSAFTLIKQNFDFFIQRWIDRHYMPITLRNLKAEDVIAVMGEEDEINDIVEKISTSVVGKKVKKMMKNKQQLTPQMVQEMLAKTDKQIKDRKSIFIKLMKKLAAKNVTTRVYVTNEELNVPVLLSNLVNMMNAAPEFRIPLMKYAFDLMSIDWPDKDELQQSMQMAQPQGQAPQVAPMNQQQLQTQASVPGQPA